MKEKSFLSWIFNWGWFYFIFIFRGNNLMAIKCLVICPLAIILVRHQVQWRQIRRLDSKNENFSKSPDANENRTCYTHGCTYDGVMANCWASSDLISGDATNPRLLRRQVTSANPKENWVLGIHDWTLVKVRDDVKVNVIVFTFLLNKL